MSTGPQHTASPQAEAFAAVAEQFRQAEQWSPAELAKVQTELLGRLLADAAAHVPWHREHTAPVLRDAPGESPLTLLERVPVLTRTMIQAQQAALVSERHQPDGVVDFSTSGSTGTPVTVRWNRAANLVQAGLVARHYRWFDSDPAAKLAGLRVVTGSDGVRRGRGWFPGAAAGETADMDASFPVRKQLEWLLREDPRYLMTYPSNARALLLEARAQGVKPTRLERIHSFGEAMADELPALARSIWNVPVADRYSAREVGLVAIQCPTGDGYHVQAESVLVELLDAHDRPVPEGETGRVVITNLHNRAMPMIRYAIGDYAAAGPPCRCGSPLPVLKRILGRTRNMFVMPDGDVLWPRFSSQELGNVAPIRQFQLVQTSLDEVIFRLVAMRAITAEEESTLESLVRRRLLGDYRLEFRYVDDIPRSASGKYEDFRSEVAQDGAVSHA